MPVYEVIVSGMAISGRKYTMLSEEGYVESDLEPEELATDILERLKAANIRLVRTPTMAANDEDRIQVNIRSEELPTEREETTFDDFVNKSKTYIEENLKESKYGKSHHATGIGSSKQRRMKTGVSNLYKKEYEEGGTGGH